MNMNLRWERSWILILFAIAASVLLVRTVTATATELPVITVSENVHNTSLFPFYNGTLLVISKNTPFVRLICTAPYPVAWDRASLREMWVERTGAFRTVPDFWNVSSYTYSIWIDLFISHDRNPVRYQTKNHKSWYSEFVCRSSTSASAVRDQSETMHINGAHAHAYLRVEWESLTNSASFWPPTWTKNLVLWAEGDGDEILIPCHTLNAGVPRVELYIKETGNGTTRTWLGSTSSESWLSATEKHIRGDVDGPPIRYKLQVGFFIPIALARAATPDTLFECYDRKLNEYGSRTVLPIMSFYLRTVSAARGWIRDRERPNQIHRDRDHASAFLDQNNPSLTMALVDVRKYGVQGRYTWTTVECCVSPAAPLARDRSWYTIDNMYMRYETCNNGPLMCLANTDADESHRPDQRGERVPGSGRCLSVNKTYPSSYWYTGRGSIPFSLDVALYICGINEPPLVRKANGWSSRPSQSYLLVAEPRLSATEFYYVDVYDEDRRVRLDEPGLHKINITDECEEGGPNGNGTRTATVRLYEGQIVRLICAGNRFIFANASRPVYELEWANGTTTISQEGDESDPNSVLWWEKGYLVMNVTGSLRKVSCHLPPWDSTDWVTRTAILDVKEPSPPITKDGRAYALEYVEMFVGEAKVLSCDFFGHPPPKYEWVLNPFSGLGFQYFDEYAAPTLSPALKDIIVWVSGAAYVQNSTLEIPAEVFSCTATNRFGNSTKQFRVRPKRPTSPIFKYEGRDLSPVLYLHTSGSLTCTCREGAPRPEFQWQRDGMNLTSNEYYNIVLSDSGSSSTSTLLFSHGAALEDEGEYRCVAFNVGGNVSVTFHVRVREAPPGWRFLLAVGLVAISCAGAILIIGLVAYCVWARRFRQSEVRGPNDTWLFGRACS